ncbi:alpha/beta hydrolase, partial [Streptomyces sp. SID10244]|nr:alpha/beta hydrolase [Streptomyces sp. SID10244]
MDSSRNRFPRGEDFWNDGWVSSVTAGEQVDGGVYVDVDGRRVWHFHGGDPSGQAIVLLHGAFGSAATWGSQIADFTGVG